MIENILVYLTIGALTGVVLGYFFFVYARKMYIRQAETEGIELIEDAKEQSDLKEIERNEIQSDLEMELWTKAEPDMIKLEEKVTDLEEDFQDRKKKDDDAWSVLRAAQEEQTQIMKSKESEVKKKQNLQNEFKVSIKNQKQNLLKALSDKLNISIQSAKDDVQKVFLSEVSSQIKKEFENYELEVKEQQEEISKRFLDAALDRFSRPYCPERGISSVYFPEHYKKEWLTGANNENLSLIQELTGCDIIVENENDLVGVAGFDPVRRELTRRLLERLLREKKPISLDFITRNYHNQKNELFRQIKHDGDAIAKELKIENMHPEIKQMMGSLRFRYSFTQNQYFHCSEVGWLCGLLSSELGVDIKIGKRSGLLHDIGKSMDHAMDGGHAVIGANFISKRGESADVVHNVKAHHYDETPNSIHAFLVIAADAISGARPGARRSTLESYAQKVTELQEIARGFDGVTDCFVLSGGRECRVYVNNKKINDLMALELSQKIASKVEEECNYPGQIKIMVVRETVAQEQTAGKK